MSDVDAPHRLVVLDEPMMVRFVRVLGGPGAWGAPFALSGIRAFGRRAGDPPETPPVSAVRFDDRTARVSWTSTPDTEGVDVRYGRAPDRLVHSWLVYGRDDLVIPMLSAGLDYWVAVDAFNGSGVTRGVPVPIDRAG